MRYQVLSHLPLAIGRRTPPTRWASAWVCAWDGMRAALAEAALYACGNPRSRLHGQAALRELDAHLRHDIGLATNAPEAMPCASFEGHR